MFKAKEMMNTRVVSVRPEDTTDRAIALMVKHQISGLPVVDEADRLRGIVSEFDLLELACDCWTVKNRVRDYMSTEILTVDEEDDWSEIAELFLCNHLRRLPVMRDGRFVGIISRHDVIRSIQELRQRIMQTLPWPEAQQRIDDELTCSPHPDKRPLDRRVNRRILVIDGSPSIFEYFRGVLGAQEAGQPAAEQPVAPAGDSPSTQAAAGAFEVDSTCDGQGGLEMIRQGVAEGRPYAVAFVGSHMPLGWNGAETIAHIREEFPGLQIILCADPSDSTVAGLLTQFGGDERLLIMKRPLEAVELRQLAEAITRRWRAEHESSQYTAALEEARHAAESANRAKSQFISNMSHEIRTPMNAILGFSQSLMNDPLTPHQLEKLHYIHDSGKTLLRLIDDVIDFSQLSAGVLVLKHVDFDLEALMQDVLAGSASAAREKNLTVKYYADASLPRWLYGDQKRLRQVLRNLIDNAIKFTEQGTVEVRTRLETVRDQSVALRLTVSDTGVGIREDHQTMVFDSFYQVDGSETRRFEGVGLGLAICKQIVHLMGGYIGVHSVLGEGSTFWVAVAFQQSATGKSDQTADPAGSSSEPTSVFGAAPATDEPPEAGRTPEECLGSMRAALGAEDYCLLESYAQTLRDQATQQAWRSVSRRALQAVIGARSGDRERITAAIGKLEDALQECREAVTGVARAAT